MKDQESLVRINAESMTTQQAEFSTTNDFLERARVRVAKVNHLKDIFPDLIPLQSPIAERAERS